MTTTSIQTLASTTRALFVEKSRNDGAKFWSYDHNSPDVPAWLQPLCFEIHGDISPDDHKYRFIVEALDALAECDDPEDADVEADIYNHELTTWLGSHGYRPGYCDEALEELGGDFESTIQLLQLGQYAEKREVLDTVRACLEAHSGEATDEDLPETD